MSDANRDRAFTKPGDQTTEALDMGDPSDRELHSKKGKHPYPPPAKTQVKGKAKDDTVDPAERNEDAPHDRGVEKDGRYETGTEAMRREIQDDREKWRKGETQD